MNKMTVFERIIEWWNWVTKDGWYLERVIAGTGAHCDGDKSEAIRINTEVWVNRKTGRMKPIKAAQSKM